MVVTPDSSIGSMAFGYVKTIRCVDYDNVLTMTMYSIIRISIRK
jgi:hypothetical protein